MDHFRFSFIKAKSIVKRPEPNVFKATAKFPRCIILPVRLKSYINLSVVSVHRQLNPLVRINDLRQWAGVENEEKWADYAIETGPWILLPCTL